MGLFVLDLYLFISIAGVFFCIVDKNYQFDGISLGIKCSVNKIWPFATKPPISVENDSANEQLEGDIWSKRSNCLICLPKSPKTKQYLIYHDVKLWKAVNPHIWENGPSQCLTFLLKRSKIKRLSKWLLTYLHSVINRWIISALKLVLIICLKT